MSSLEAFWGSPLVYRLGCGLLHFFWQGALIAMLLGVAMWMLRGRSAGARYLVAWTALLAMAGSVPTTAWLVPSPPATEAARAALLPPEMELPTNSLETGARPLRPHLGGGSGVEPPAARAPAASRAIGAADSPGEVRAATGDPPAARASQWIRTALPWVVCCWVAGTLALALWRLGGWTYLRRLCRLGTRPASDAAGQMLDRLRKRLEIDRAVQLLESTRIEVPAVIGWLRPVILLPVSILSELPADQLELILAHELAHIRRHDFLLNLLQTAVETLLFYHPAVWWVSCRIRIEREACCDDLAVAGYPPGGGDRLLYARALTRLEELRHPPAGPLAARVGVAADGAPLLPRIRRVVGLPGSDQEGRRTWLGGSIAVLLLVGALVGYAATAGEPQSTPAGRPGGGPAARSAEKAAAGSSSTSSSSGAEWGQAVEGVQVRLRAAKSRWNEGAKGRLWADVRNPGKRNLLVDAWGPGCELEVDGQWYRQPLGMRGTRPALRPFAPGHQYDNIAVDVDQSWELKSSQNAGRPGQSEPVRLVLTPGKHTISVAFTATAAKNAPGEPVRAVSNPVVIEIISAREIAARPERLKSQKNAFELRLAYHGPRENPNQSGVDPIRSLILHTTLVDYDLLHGWSAISISEEQAARIVNHLQVEGSLVDALPFTEDRPPPDLDGPAYSLTVKGPENLVLYKPVGWGLTVLDFLERLRTVLDGKPAEALDQLMAVLGPQRKQWEAVAKWGQAVEGVQVRLRAQRSQWRQDVTPRLMADVRNLGQRNLLVCRAVNSWTSCELEVDGRWYRRPLPTHDYRPPMFPLAPGRQYDTIWVLPDHWWELTTSPNEDAGGTGVTGSEPERLKLTDGRHMIRVAITMQASGSEPGQDVRIVSNPVEIEIVADSNEKVGAAPGGNADVTTAEPSVEATGAKPDDQTAPARPVNDPAKTQTPPAGGPGSSGGEKPRYAGEGLVVDDVTGKPVEQIAVQEGVPNPGAESGIMWITMIQSEKGVPGGRFSITHNCVKQGKVRIRIVAGGYLPEVAIVDTEDGLLKAPLVMRLRRGEAILGRVIDHAGKPVAGAEVFLGGPDRHAEIVDGKTEGFGGTRETTDADGRFVIHGAAAGEANRLVLLAPGLHVWTVPVLELRKELIVKLPEPATVVIRYDIPGDVPEGRFRLELKTWDMPDWKGIVSSVQNPTAKNQGEVVLRNMTPGVYDVIRMKQLRVADFGTEAFCDRRDVTLESGKTTTLQFVRKKAFAIEGDVVGLEGTGIEGAFVFVRSPKATGDPESRDDWKLPIYDGVTCAKDGKFKTAPIEPGEYLLVADAYEPQPGGMGFGMGFGTGWSLPAYVGKAKVTVPQDGPPPRVRIEMKPRSTGGKATPAVKLPETSAEPNIEAVPTKRVVDAQGSPISGAKVGFYEHRTPRGERPFSSTVTDEDGKFPCPDQAPDKVRFSFYLVISAPGFRTGEWLGNYRVDGRRRGAPLPDTLRLDRPVTISGTVLGSDGKPLAGVPLAVDYFNQRGTWANPRRIQSDEQGSFKIDDLPPGDIFIRYEKRQDDVSKRADDAQLFISHVQAQDGQQIENVVVDLSQAKCVLEGQVVDHDGKGIANASVKATFAASAMRLAHYAWARTDQDGRYRIGGLPPHEFLVSASTKNHYGGLGERVKLEMGAAKTIRLLGYIPGHPAPEPKPDDARWGKPAGDLRAAIELRPSRETYSMGETVDVRPILRNTGEKTVTLIHDFAAAVELHVTDEAGTVQTFSYKNFSGRTVATTYLLEPGHEVEMQGRFGLKLVRADFAEHLIQSPGTPLAFALKCRPGAKYILSYDLGDGVRTGEASFVVKD
jgi:beta-lactamase regulating signal transducer with metallopeptidase domain/protocatechuate 3,4-dioxygenase beta subunit